MSNLPLVRTIRLFALASAAAAVVACGSSSPTAPAAAVIATPSTPSSPVAGPTQGTHLTALTQTGVTVHALAGGGGTNYTCSQLAGMLGGSGAEWLGDNAKYDNAPSGTHVVTDQYITATITSGTATTFNWSSDVPVDAVFVKSGQGHNLYVYSGESTGGTGLTTPTGQDISHVNFCYDVDLRVSKTATTTFTRDYDWTIAKSADQAALTMASTDQATVNYSVSAVKDAGTDSDWAVKGTITVANPHPTLTATGISVTDSLSAFGDVTVSCPATSLAGGASMTCSYGSVALPSGDARTNTASADSTTYGIVAGQGTAPVSFVTPTTVLDNTVSVSDTFAGAGLNGTSISASQTFNYARTVAGSSQTCGTTATLENTASLGTDDAATRSASANVAVTVTCPPPPPPPAATGCTLTQGYWGTHSSKGPAKYDATWALIGENTPFYQSGTSYHGVLQLPTRGNAYYVLAHQFIAAKLNVLKGATPPAGFDMGAVETFFQTYTPATIAAMKTSAVRTQAIAWASTLDRYNNGLLNVSHCGS